MGNMCCRRVGYSPNGADLDQNRCHQQQLQQQQQKTQAMSNAYHNAGDDCAINELLEGRMDLDVILPDGRQVRLTVERRTPMMDLLVQAASATKISPAGHVIHVFGDGGKESGSLHYKPSTPIGSLDTNTICIVPKKDSIENHGKRTHKLANRPFEPTFRVQVHLPRNQLTVARVSPRMKVAELRNMVCHEKGLDISKYQLVRPNDPSQPLAGDMTLAEYGSTEITLLSNSCIESHICNSTSHIIPYSKRSDDIKKKAGILRLLAEDARQNSSKTSKISNTDGINRNSTLANEDDLQPHQGRYKPKKRRPAPPPPPPLPEAPSHSRQSSSDSSGYHEATSSFLHEEHCLTVAEKASSDSSGVSSLDAKIPAIQMPQATIISNSKKRKAPAPPPPHVSETTPVVQKEDLTEYLEARDGSQPIRSQTTVEVKSAELTTDIPNDAVFVKKPAPVIVKERKSVSSNETYNSKEPEVDKTTKSTSASDDGEAVTRVALVALNARIEQDVTQQEIASSIQAAFQSLDCPQRTEPSLLAIKQRSTPTQDRSEEVSASDDINEDPDPSSCLSSPEIKCEQLDYPDDSSNLQKTTVRLSLNLESKQSEDEELEPCQEPIAPPPDFRSIEKEALVIDEDHAPKPPPATHLKTLKRSSSLLNLKDVAPKSGIHKNSKNIRHIQRSLSDLCADDKEEFEAEQERLQREYIKLQRQFILWQQQLLNNHAMLREECIVPQYARTLRQSHSLPEGEDYSDEPLTSAPLVSRSLSYEPTKEKCSTLPRSTINIPSLEFGPIPINSGSSTLRSSKTKNYFKPPQVRTSTKSRQRLPPEIRKEGDLDISDDTKMLSTILPSFESLKLIAENNDEDFQSNISRLKKPLHIVKSDIKSNVRQQSECKTQSPQLPLKVCTFPKPHSKEDNGDRNHTMNNDKYLNGGNEDRSHSNVALGPVNTKESKDNLLPPPPPPLPVGKISKGSCPDVPRKSTGLRNSSERKELAPQIDPREQLMQEIRKFGGRTA
ncbi:hypothetical protein X975_04266, partial [Stegodyphus mimosarum]